MKTLGLIALLVTGCNQGKRSPLESDNNKTPTEDSLGTVLTENSEPSATFFADTTNLWQDVGQRKQHLNRVMEMEWRISGQVLSFGSKPIVIRPDPKKIDTLFYRQNKDAKWDTIICNIKKPLMYKFTYNTCCDGFNILEANDKHIIGKVNFKLLGKQSNKSFLGTLGESGILVKANATNTLLPGCRSAMSPNIYSISFREVNICSDALNCVEETCLYEEGKKDLNYEFSYKTISTKLEILFMPLSSDPIEVSYDTKFDKCSIN